MTVRIPDTIAAPRLEIRRLRVDDAAALVEAVTASIEHLRPWMPWIALEPQTVEQRVGYIERTGKEWEDGGDMPVALFADGRLVGCAGLHHRVGPDGLEVGYWVHVDHIGRGYATEATVALTTLAFTMDRIERVRLRHDVTNHRSAAVPRRLGFRVVEEVGDGRTAPGECGITRAWEVRRADWEARVR